MPRLSDKLRDFLKDCVGREVGLDYLRRELRIDPGTPAWDGLRVQMLNMVKEKIVKSSGRKDGVYKVLKQIRPIAVYSQPRERRPLFDLRFPLDFDTSQELWHHNVN